MISGYTLESFLFPHGSTVFDQNRFGQIWDSDIQGERHCLIPAHASPSVFTISLFTYRYVPHKRALDYSYTWQLYRSVLRIYVYLKHIFVMQRLNEHRLWSKRTM